MTDQFDINAEIKKHQKLTMEEFNNIHTEWKATNSKPLFDKMIQCNLGLLMSIASKRAFVSKALDKDDLFQAGYFGLERAIEKYDASQGYTFSTYATNWIKDFCQRYAENTSTSIRTPTYRVKELKQYQKAIAGIGNDNASGQEILDWCKNNGVVIQSKITPKYVETALREHKCSRVSSVIVEDGDATDAYSPDKGDVIGDGVHSDQIVDMLSKIIQSDTITERERIVICHRFELFGHTKLSHKDIAPLIGCTRQNVQKIEIVVRAKIKDALKFNELSEVM